MEYRICVSILIKKGNQILMGKKASGKGPYPDTWHLPGGGIEFEKETCEDAVVREIKEETGIEVKNLKKIAWDTDVEPNKHGIPTYYVFLQFMADYKSGKLASNDDLKHVEWVKIEKIPTLTLNKPTIRLLEKVKL